MSFRQQWMMWFSVLIKNLDKNRCFATRLVDAFRGFWEFTTLDEASTGDMLKKLISIPTEAKSKTACAASQQLIPHLRQSFGPKWTERNLPRQNRSIHPLSDMERKSLLKIISYLKHQFIGLAKRQNTNTHANWSMLWQQQQLHIDIDEDNQLSAFSQ